MTFDDHFKSEKDNMTSIKQTLGICTFPYIYNPSYDINDIYITIFLMNAQKVDMVIDDTGLLKEKENVLDSS